MKHSLVVLMVAAFLGAGTVAHAQDDSPTADAIKRASEEFSLGKQSYRDEDFVEAAEHFEAADDRAPSVNALRAAMTSRNKAGQLDRAATLAALALRRHPEDTKLAEEAQAILDEAKATLHRVEVSCDVPCLLVVGTSLVHGGAATEQTLYLPPGQAEIRASFSGGSGTQTQSVVAIAEGEDRLQFARPEAVTEEPAKDATPPAKPEPGTDEFGMDTGGEEPPGGAGTTGTKAHHGLPPGVFVAGIIGTAVLGGVTVWSGVDTMNNPGTAKVKALCQDNPNYPDPTTCPAYQTGQNKELRTNILIGATAGVGVATIIIGVVTDWHGKPAAGAARSSRATAQRGVTPWIGVGDGAMVGARGRF